MTEYKKPHLKLGEILLLLDEEYDPVCVINADNTVALNGTVGDIKYDQGVEYYKKIKERYVNKISFDDYGDYVIFLEAENGKEGV